MEIQEHTPGQGKPARLPIALCERRIHTPTYGWSMVWRASREVSLVRCTRSARADRCIQTRLESYSLALPVCAQAAVRHPSTDTDVEAPAIDRQTASADGRLPGGRDA